MNQTTRPGAAERLREGRDNFCIAAAPAGDPRENELAIALSLAQCDLGKDCSAGSWETLNECAFENRCNQNARNSWQQRYDQQQIAWIDGCVPCSRLAHHATRGALLFQGSRTGLRPAVNRFGLRSEMQKEFIHRVPSQPRVDESALDRPVFLDRDPQKASTVLERKAMVRLGRRDEGVA